MALADSMHGGERLPQPDLVSRYIEHGLLLKEQTLAIIASWQFDDKTGAFPEFITGKRHLLGDLEIPIERWFNEVDVLTGDSREYSKNTLQECLSAILRPFAFLLHRELERSGAQDRDSIMQGESCDFDAAIRKLQTLPRLPKHSLGPEFAAFTVQPNSAFILMWMSRQRPELEDASNSFKEVFEEFDIRAKRADDIEHQDVITDVIFAPHS